MNDGEHLPIFAPVHSNTYPVTRLNFSTLANATKSEDGMKNEPGQLDGVDLLAIAIGDAHSFRVSVHKYSSGINWNKAHPDDARKFPNLLCHLKVTRALPCSVPGRENIF